VRAFPVDAVEGPHRVLVAKRREDSVPSPGHWWVELPPGCSVMSYLRSIVGIRPHHSKDLEGTLIG
jgi:hypothetical protein